MFLSILLFPLSFFLFTLVCSELKPKTVLFSCVFFYSIILTLSGYLLLNSCFFNYSGKFVYCYQFFNWTTISNLDVVFSVWLDYVSTMMSFTVLFIATMVNIFSIYYMANDPFIIRFFSYLSLFTFCMLLLVLSSDLMQFFIGWELVGLCSYLLINFWYTRKKANASAAKALLVNRIGDFFFILGMSSIMSKFGTLNIYDISWLVVTNSYDSIPYNTICFFFFIAVMSKSAQIGLHSWLPDAMEGPTPVSALIHAATMVTAGIYLLLRLSTLFLVATSMSKIVIIVGCSTAIFGATTGAAQTDIKKIIAFSTCSQLGYMVTACGLAQYNLAFFHLITHAFFKSLLFLSAGVIIHTLGGEQDIRKMGSLRNILPITYTAIAIASLALSGIPYLSGYYSKELIIAAAFIDNTWVGYLSGIILTLSAICTSGYSAKLIYFIFFLKTKDTKISEFYHLENSEKLEYFQTVPLSILTIMSIFVGYIFKDSLVGIGSNTTLSMINDFALNNTKSLWLEFLPYSFKLILTLSSFSGFIYYALIHFKVFNINYFFEKNKKIYNIYDFFLNRWKLDAIYLYFSTYFFLFLFKDRSVESIYRRFVDRFTVRVIYGASETINNIYGSTTVLTPYQYIKKTMISCILIAIFYSFSIDIYLYV